MWAPIEDSCKDRGCFSYLPFPSVVAQFVASAADIVVVGHRNWRFAQVPVAASVAANNEALAVDCSGRRDSIAVIAAAFVAVAAESRYCKTTVGFAVALVTVVQDY